jgi:hypothetical protein
MSPGWRASGGWNKLSMRRKLPEPTKAEMAWVRSKKRMRL